MKEITTQQAEQLLDEFKNNSNPDKHENFLKENDQRKRELFIKRMQNDEAFADEVYYQIYNLREEEGYNMDGINSFKKNTSLEQIYMLSNLYGGKIVLLRNLLNKIEQKFYKNQNKMDNPNFVFVENQKEEAIKSILDLVNSKLPHGTKVDISNLKLNSLERLIEIQNDLLNFKK